ncbi:MAG: hypothetical protein GX847_01805, partial [Clostridiales bacterium]|nr:hypothetical protein [Clostridiales bacterium]
MKKKSLLALLIALVLVFGLLAGCAEKAKTPPDTSPSAAPSEDQTGEEEYPDKDPSKTTIKIAAVRPITGTNASFEIYNYGPVYKMWVDEVNAAGGIRVKEYGNRQLTIDLTVYD